MLKKLTLLFPGQGSQRVGMADELLNNWKKPVKYVLEEASEAMQYNLETLLQDGPQEKLTQTKYAQPAILSHSIAILRILEVIRTRR
jgi:[acyl-carrier-protein] S-malonyltransferase